MNILLCSVGRRVQLVNYFREELNKIGGKVVAVDCDLTAPALYHADSYELVPRITHADYMDSLITICKKHEIKGILSLIDPELSLLSTYKDCFQMEGISLILPDKWIVDLCYDKYLTSLFLQEKGLPNIPTYDNFHSVKEAVTKSKIQCPFIVKPKYGSASIGVHKISSLKELSEFMKNHDDYIIQPFQSGDEFCVECYVDIYTHEITSFFSKRKLNMRSGETDKSIEIHDSVLFQLTKELVTILKPVGPIDIDWFKTEKGYVISEINPRFGGGYPYAHEMGNNFITQIISNLQGVSSVPTEEYSGPYAEGKTMVRYDTFVVLSSSNKTTIVK
ncbi:ATP-grasp domain-containing protein [Evansella tamaricis]|uniref:ATP-grasp domain-containing protein n=1 Tax=Evansella tamaricis TaxID=2069301 RepID=A0ABS6JES3_9BACI|nr:ATP-grasp domain-containing protein [Evansella tamaricis]MBU9712172.1 ATP-grasp domain-containing protein [Evansella tamaricis]